MITTKHGSIFDSTAQVLVCPVNCVGVMGAGLAKEFKRRFPEESSQYMALARCDGGMSPGSVVTRGNIHFAATKNHWRNPSRIEWVDDVLHIIAIECPFIPSIAIPQLGCGCGGLDWADVWPLYEKHLGGMDVDVEVWIHD